MYQLMKNPQDVVCAVNETIDGVQYSIPFAPDNTDYVRFKKEILADEAQLQDADGNTMTPEQAKTYVGGLA